MTSIFRWIADYGWLEGRVLLAGIILLASCAPKDSVEFRAIKNITLETGPANEPLLKGEAVFYNPNRVRMKLREINLGVWLNGKKCAQIDQKPDLVIPRSAEFSASVEARLSLKEFGLLDAVFSLFGGKKYDVRYSGYLRVRVHGVTVKIPIEYAGQVQLKI